MRRGGNIRRVSVQIRVTGLDHIVLFSGDGDFRSLVAALQQKGKRVSVVSSLQTQPPMVADELRRQADQFIELADLEQMICRDPTTRPPRTERTERFTPTTTAPRRAEAFSGSGRSPVDPVPFDDDPDDKDPRG